MQIIVNCFARVHSGIVMLQKPRHGWWVLPGGKVEPDESWPEAARREMREETGLVIDDLRLRGVHALQIASSDGVLKRRLIVQFSADHVTGTLLEDCKEGKLSVIQPSALVDLPMDPGDKIMVYQTLDATLHNLMDVYFGKFTYTEALELTDWSMEPSPFHDLGQTISSWGEKHPL
jgi:8-oxo-dGTP diphosphatase